jgi:hypothetical protein
MYVLIYVCLLYNAFFKSKDEHGLTVGHVNSTGMVPRYRHKPDKTCQITYRREQQSLQRTTITATYAKSPGQACASCLERH